VGACSRRARDARALASDDEDSFDDSFIDDDDDGSEEKNPLEDDEASEIFSDIAAEEGDSPNLPFGGAPPARRGTVQSPIELD